jgi:hypothetical protein
LLTESDPEPAGNCSRTAGGTVKVPALTGAVQMKDALKMSANNTAELPLISAYVPEAPPVQLTVTPDDRLMVPIEVAFVHVSGLKKATEALLNAPTSVPPEPANV